MAKGFNKVILMGNLTRDPEVRTTQGGTSVTSFGLAVNRNWKGQDGTMQEDVNFIDCTAWARTGEVIAQYVQKGRALLVSGRLNQRSWEQDGQKRSKVEVVVEDFNFVGGGDASGGSSGSSTSVSSSSSSSSSSSNNKKEDVAIEDVGEEPINLDDIPF
jgi:single-strand DNA-binding protein